MSLFLCSSSHHISVSFSILHRNKWNKLLLNSRCDNIRNKSKIKAVSHLILPLLPLNILFPIQCSRLCIPRHRLVKQFQPWRNFSCNQEEEDKRWWDQRQGWLFPKFLKSHPWELWRILTFPTATRISCSQTPSGSGSCYVCWRPCHGQVLSWEFQTSLASFSIGEDRWWSSIHVCEVVLHGLVFVGPLLYQLMLCISNLHSLQRDADLMRCGKNNLNVKWEL